MQINLPVKLRFALYVVTGVGSLVMIYLSSKGIVGEAELKFWAGFTTFIGGLAAVNTK